MKMGKILEQWLKKSPCKGCLCLDEDTIPVLGVGAKVNYCEIVTDIDKFFKRFYGEKKANGEHKFLNCPHKNYIL